MRVGINDTCTLHDPGRVHPDSVARFRTLIEVFEDHPAAEVVEPSRAKRPALERVHDPGYLDRLEAFCTDGGGAWDPDTVASTDTYRASLASAGAALWAARSAGVPVGGGTPFGLTRPPGHHAVPDDAMGFCFLNNVAVAAVTLLEDGAADRVGIVDWDVHHANGTEACVEDYPAISLVSLHQAGLYPGTGRFDPNDEQVLNVPLPRPLDDAGYLQALEATAVPAMDRVDPDVLLVSCGFDAHERDVLSTQRMTADGYGLLTGAIADLAGELDAGLGFVLEGGYAVDVVGDCARAVVDALEGHVPARPDAGTNRPLEDALDRVSGHPLLVD